MSTLKQLREECLTQFHHQAGLCECFKDVDKYPKRLKIGSLFLETFGQGKYVGWLKHLKQTVLPPEAELQKRADRAD